jgi:phosphate starvation-inducible membrane PsiE
VTDQVTAPAGWYADPHGAPALRWWDGANWTDHLATTGGPAARRALPADVSPDTPWIWLAVLLPVLSLGTLFALDVRDMMQGMVEQPNNPFAVYGVGYLAAVAASYLIAGVVVWFSYLDWKALKAKGVDRPFHWAWAFFIGYPVYVIGRSVIVHQVSKRGLGPIWAYIGVVVLSFIVCAVWFVWIFQTMFDFASQRYGSYY